MGRGRGPAPSSKSMRDRKKIKPMVRFREDHDSDDTDVEASASRAVEAKLRRVRKKVGNAQLPAQLKKLRACMICSLIKTEKEFEDEGCDNCEPFLHLAGQRGSIASYTSANFEGLIGLIKPEESWVAKWQHLMPLKPGMYAVSVAGEVDQWVEDEMKETGRRYFSRDKNLKDRIAKSKKADVDDESLLSKGRRSSRNKGAINLESDDDDDNEIEDSSEVRNERGATTGAEADMDIFTEEAIANDSQEMAEELDESNEPGSNESNDVESGLRADGELEGGNIPLETEMTMRSIGVKEEYEVDDDDEVDTATIVRGDLEDPKTPAYRYIPTITRTKLPVLPPASEMSSAPYRSGKMYASASSEDEEEEPEESGSDSE